MANMNTSHRYIYDAAPATLFRARTAAAATADGNSNVVTLDKLEGYWNTAGELADETLAVVINVTDVDTTTGDETYSLTLQAVDSSGSVLGNVTLGGFVVPGIGQYVLLLDVPTIQSIQSGLSGLRLALDVGGTTPSITYHAWLTQIKG